MPKIIINLPSNLDDSIVDFQRATKRAGLPSVTKEDVIIKLSNISQRQLDKETQELKAEAQS